MFPQSAPPQQPQAQAQPEPGSSAAGSSEPAGRGGGMDGGQGASRPGGGGGGVGRPPVSTQEVQHVQNLIERCMQQYLPQVRGHACMAKTRVLTPPLFLLLSLLPKLQAQEFRAAQLRLITSHLLIALSPFSLFTTPSSSSFLRRRR